MGLDETSTISFGGGEGGGADGGGAAAGADEKTIFNVNVTGFDDKSKIKVKVLPSARYCYEVAGYS